MIAKLERTQSNAYQIKDKHRNPANNGKYIKQYINNNNRTTALEWTAAQATGGGGGGGGGGLNAFYCRQIFALDSVVVKAQTCLARSETS